MRETSFTIINKDVREGLKELYDNGVRVDCIVSSPPYFKQRNYGVAGQIGLEKTSQEYVDTITEVFYDYCFPLLKPSGLLFLNIGDSYNSSGAGNKSPSGFSQKSIVSQRGGNAKFGQPNNQSLAKIDKGYKERDLLNVPYRVYEALTAKGYYWRSTVIWHKPNAMPESVMGVRWVRHQVKIRNIPVEETQWKKNKIAGIEGSGAGNHSEVEWQNCGGCDICNPNDGYILKWGSGRPVSSYETVAILTKKDYYWDTEAVRTVYAESSVERRKHPLGGFGVDNGSGTRMNPQVDGTRLEDKYTGASLRNVWRISTKSSGLEHFATFPIELPELCIKAGSSEYGCCAECGAPYARMIDRVIGEVRNDRGADGSGFDDRRNPKDIFAQSTSTVLKTVGWKATCNCNCDKVVPSIVLDPFSGMATSGVAADNLGRNYYGTELNPDYARDSVNRMMVNKAKREQAKLKEKMKPVPLF